MKQELLQILDYVLESSTSIKLHVDKIFELRSSLDSLLTDEEKIEITNRIKSRVQREAIEAIDARNGFGAVFVSTGSGKSKIGVTLTERVVDQNYQSTSPDTVLIVVPTEKLRDTNWPDEFNKWGKGHLITSNLVMCCYASLNKFVGRTFGLVILDEGHNTTESNSEFFDHNIVKSCVLLTATKPRDKIKQEILRRLNLIAAYELSTDDSVKLGLIAPYQITVVTMYLDNVNKNVQKTSKDKELVTEKVRYNILSAACSKIKNKFIYLTRMRFIYNLKSKTEAARYILDEVIPYGLKTIIFCGSIDQAENLCAYYYHSKSNDDYFNRFKEGSINRMSCVNAVNEGHNIENLDCGFVVQLNSNDLHFIQRMGRSLRYRPGHIGRIIVLCVIDTVDKEWVNKALSSLDKDNINFIELARLKMGIETISFD